MIVLIVMIFLMLLFGLFWFKMRRTAYSVAQKITNMEISREYKIETYKDEWASNGDGQSLIIFSIPQTQLSYFVQACVKKGFRKLPIKENLPDNLIYNYIDHLDTLGYYDLSIDKTDDRNYKLIVFYQVEKKLIIYNVIY